MFAAKITELGFIRNDNQTVGYAKNCASFIDGEDGTGFQSDCVYTNKIDSSFKMCVGDTRNEVLELSRKQVEEYLLGVSWIQANPDDFYFRYIISDIDKKGYFWAPAGNGGRKWRVSDLEVL